MKNDFSQIINDNICERFVAKESKGIPISDPIIQKYAQSLEVTFELNLLVTRSM
jgi:hypothetical protein